jgi:hypothetical protein
MRRSSPVLVLLLAFSYLSFGSLPILQGEPLSEKWRTGLKKIDQELWNRRA